MPLKNILFVFFMLIICPLVRAEQDPLSISDSSDFNNDESLKSKKTSYSGYHTIGTARDLSPSDTSDFTPEESLKQKKTYAGYAYHNAAADANKEARAKRLADQAQRDQMAREYRMRPYHRTIQKQQQEAQAQAAAAQQQLAQQTAQQGGQQPPAQPPAY